MQAVVQYYSLSTLIHFEGLETTVPSDLWRTMGALPPRTTTTSTTTPAITYKGETVMWLQVDRFGGLQRAAQSEACGIEGQLLIIKLMEESGRSLEGVVEVQYLEKIPPP
ncbi:uncharacterized protein LOC135098719 [Scylla paramamosain]|uniref:uncharacterized protein LOC135098719 n=1 Tax=Scylla paramamosain TaxID=85552 RepID=UPI003083B28D